jgi:23S rRNA (adenine2030-N6)-methyltransferase
VLIDPPFEAADEFAALDRALCQGLRRFATGCYAVWYPVKDSRLEVADVKALRIELSVPETAPGRLAACGLVVINPPWKFEEAMAEAVPWVAGRLGGRSVITSIGSRVSSPTS